MKRILTTAFVFLSLFSFAQKKDSLKKSETLTLQTEIPVTAPLYVWLNMYDLIDQSEAPNTEVRKMQRSLLSAVPGLSEALAQRAEMQQRNAQPAGKPDTTDTPNPVKRDPIPKYEPTKSKKKQ